MGLDFGLYWKNINTKDEDVYDDEHELCYGRKSWELVHVLVPDFEESEEDPLITKERWENLMRMIYPISDRLAAVSQAFDIVDNAPEDFPEMVVTDEVKRAIAEYELWYNRAFNRHPDLGYRFSVGYIKNFWDAKNKVNKYLDDPNYEVRAYVSY